MKTRRGILATTIGCALSLAVFICVGTGCGSDSSSASTAEAKDATGSTAVIIVPLGETTPVGTESKAMVEVREGEDGELSLIVTEPEDGIVVDSASVRVSGSTVAYGIVSVNGKVVDVDESGDFSTLVKLEEGFNSIEVVASDQEGMESSVILSVVNVR